MTKPAQKKQMKLDAPRSWGLLCANGKIARWADWDRRTTLGFVNPGDEVVPVRIIRESDFRKLVRGK